MDNEKIADIRPYPKQAVKWLFILHLYINAVIIIKQFNVVGAIVAVLVNCIFAFAILSGGPEKNRISERMSDFYIVDALVFTAMNIKEMVAAMQAYGKESTKLEIWTSGEAYADMIALAGAALLCLAFNSKMLLFIYSYILLYFFASGKVELTDMMDKSLIVFVVFFLVWRMLDKWRIESKRQTPEYARVKKSKRICKLIMMMIIPLWCVLIWYNRSLFNWKVVCDAFEIIYSKWIVIPVVVVMSVLVKKLITEFDDILSERVLNIYYLTFVLLLYVLVGVSLESYSTLNIFLLLLFLGYAKRKIYRGFDLTNMMIRIIRLCMYAINICIIEMLVSSGLVLNSIVTLIMEYAIVQLMKKKLCTSSLKKGEDGVDVVTVDSAKWKRLVSGEERLRKEVAVEALNETMSDMGFWIKCILAILVQVICFVCSRRLMPGAEYINILSAGIPYFKCFIVPGVIVAVTIALFAVLFMKNPMNIKPGILTCVTVITLYTVAMFWCMRPACGIRLSQTAFRANAERMIRKTEVDGKTPLDIYTGNIYDIDLKRGGFLIENYKAQNRDSKYQTFVITPGRDTEKYMIRSVGADGSVYVSASYNPAFIQKIFNEMDAE